MKSQIFRPVNILQTGNYLLTFQTRWNLYLQCQAVETILLVLPVTEDESTTIL